MISSKGLGLCTIVPLPTPLGTAPVPAGIRYRWGDDTPDVMVFSCSLDDYREVSARAAQAGAPRGLTLPAGLPSAQIRVRGAGAPPLVLLTGPKGERIEVPAGGRLFDKAFAVFPEPQLQATTIALRKPAAGRWSVSALEGSPAITSVAVARGRATPQVKVRVTGSGDRRRAVYRVQDGEGWTITLAERGSRTASAIGVAKGERGELPFTPAAGRGERRRIVAQLESPSGPATTIAVGSYRAPRERPLPRALRVIATRRSGAITVTWRRVNGAQRYAVTWVPRRGAEQSARRTHPAGAVRHRRRGRAHPAHRARWRWPRGRPAHGARSRSTLTPPRPGSFSFNSRRRPTAPLQALCDSLHGKRERQVS